MRLYYWYLFGVVIFRPDLVVLVSVGLFVGACCVVCMVLSVSFRLKAGFSLSIEWDTGLPLISNLCLFGPIKYFERYIIWLFQWFRDAVVS